MDHQGFSVTRGCPERAIIRFIGCWNPAMLDSYSPIIGKLQMQIDLKDSNALTLDAVRALIASKDDTENRQLRVTKSGIAYLSDKVGADDIDNLAFRLETWDEGNGYCGEQAAKDERWVKIVFNDLKENWPNPKSTYIDT